MTEPKILNKQMIEQLFDGAAKTYDRVGPSIFAQFGERLVAGISIVPGMHVLDIATGTGAVLLPAAQRVGREGHVIGIDLSDGILREADSLVHANNLTNVELRKMDAENLEFPDQSFDVVTCAFSLFLFPDMEAALREMYRVCKPGGCVAITHFNKTPMPLGPGLQVFIQQCRVYQVGVGTPQPLASEPEEVTALLNQLGFRSIETRSEASDLVYASEEDWWAFLLTLGPRPTILGMSEETRARFKNEYFANLHPLFRQDGLHISLGVIYALAKR